MRLLINHSLLTVLFISAVGIPQPSSAQTDPDQGYYKEPGIYPTRDYINQNASEHVDPFTGRLQLHYVDLFIPGNGGLNLEVGRSYTNVDDGATFEPSAFGVGWTMHFGRVLRSSNKALCDVNFTSGLQMPLLELPDGSRQVLFRDDTVFPAQAKFITTSRWRADCINAGAGMRVFSPNGIQYDMTLQGNAPTGQNAWYTTKISDRNGNSMTVTYGSSGTQVFPKTISTPAPDTQVVTFNYIGPVGAQHLDNVTDGTRTWRYNYTQIGISGNWLLKDVTRPDASLSKWSYLYNETGAGPGLFSIRQVTYPQGGTIAYTYARVTFASGVSPITNTVVQQKVTATQAPTSASGTWTFAYSPSTGFGANDETRVTAPNGLTTYRHVGFATIGQGEYWKVGLLVQKLTGASGAEQTETLSWISQTISNQTNLRPGNTLAFDQSTGAPVLSQKTILRDGNTYTTTFSNFDGFGNAQTVAEASTNFSRSTTLTYTVNTDPGVTRPLWVIHQVRDESVSVPGFPVFSINRFVDSTANVRQETRFGVTTNFLYDHGNLVSRTNARQKTTTFSNYSRGIPQTEIHPVSSTKNITVSRTVNPAGTVRTERDGKGDTMTYTYDGLNRLSGPAAIDYPRVGAADVAISWTATSMTLTRGTFTQTTLYDGFGRVRSITKSDSVSPSQNATVTLRYDELGRRTFQSYPGYAQGTSYIYDMLDRVKTATHGDGTRRTYAYNVNGGTAVTVNNERLIDQVASYRSFGDPDKRELMGISVPTLPSVTLSIGRNPIGQILSVSQGGRNRTYGYYPANNFLRIITDPETGDTIFRRDGVGNMTSRQVGSSLQTIYTYDDSDRLTDITFPSPTPAISKTYYDDGMLQDVQSFGIAFRHFDYDPDKNLILERLVIDGGAFEFRHTYGANDGRDTTSYPSGTSVSYASNGFGRPRQATPFLNSVDFHPTGEVRTIAYANGVTTSVTLAATRPWPEQFTSVKGASTLANFKYTYADGTGNVTKFEDFVDSTNTMPALGYDQIDRLVQASSNAEARGFGYDGVGSITSQTFGGSAMTYSYDFGTNRLSSITGTGAARSYAFSYDVYGNVTTNDGGQSTFAYDDAGNMTCARCGQGDASGYLYDGLSMRVRAQKSGVKTYFMYGLDGNLLFELTPQDAGGGLNLKEYIYLAGRQVAVRDSTQVPSTTSSSSGSISAAVGTSVTLTVNVSGASPTGTVTFKEGNTVLGTANVVNGSASLNVLGLSVGTHTVVATYSGDANNTSSSTSLTVTIYDLSWLPAILQLLLDD